MTYKSIQIFAVINMILLSFGTFEYYIFTTVQYPLLFLYISMLLKNVGFAYILDVVNTNKEYIVSRPKEIVDYTYHFKNIMVVSLMDILTLNIIIKNLAYESNITVVDYILFVPQSFCFEIIFDFFHYCFHRVLHTNKYLYKHIHSHHHNHSAINIYTTFEQHPVDLLFTNMIPLLISSYIIPSSQLFVFLFFWYKSFLEISGHLGKDNSGLSFPQFIWIPKYFHICLKSKNHNHHHIRPMKNFGKRLALWDKVFGTFEE